MTGGTDSRCKCCSGRPGMAWYLTAGSAIQVPGFAGSGELRGHQSSSSSCNLYCMTTGNYPVNSVYLEIMRIIS